MCTVGIRIGHNHNFVVACFCIELFADTAAECCNHRTDRCCGNPVEHPFQRSNFTSPGKIACLKLRPDLRTAAESPQR